MKNTPAQTRISAVFAAAIASTFCLFAASTTLAATNTWTGGSGSGNNWTDAANWGGTAPSANDRLFFDDGSGLRTSPNNDYAAGTIFNQIEFNGGSTSFTLGGNAIILTNGADTTIPGPAGGSIINNSPNANAGLQFTGTGPINLTGSSIGTINGIFGGWSYIGTDWATYDGSSNVVAYASYTDIATGAIVSAPASNVRYI